MHLTSLLLLSGLLILFGLMTNSSFAVSNPVSVDGYFNILEKRYENGTHTFEYYLFEKNNEHTVAHQLIFDQVPENILELSGDNVHVDGLKNNLRAIEHSDSKIIVDFIDYSHQNNLSENLTQRKSLRSVPEDLKTVVIPSKVSDSSTEPHPKSYFETRFFTDSDSLKEYWEATSYGAITMSGGTDDLTGVTDWNVLPETALYYFSNNDSVLAQDAISLVDSNIDFDGNDNTIQNSGPQIGGPGDNGDDVDEVVFVVNEDWANCSCAYAYLDPFEISTDEGSLFVYAVFTYDSGGDFPVGINFENGVGVIAHEMGHNFGWEHTPPPSGLDTYADPWSLMSGGDADGPPGTIAFNRDEAGWIPDADKITIPEGTEDTVTLDILSESSPSSNYLMVEIPFGSSGEYYILEARKDSTFDQTPLDQFGLIIYHYNPDGHVGSPEDSAPVNIVDTTGTGDFENSDLDLGDSYTQNGVIIEYLEDTENTITVTINNNVVSDSFSLDASGTAKLSKAVTKGAYKFNKGTYTVTVNISADIDSVNSKGIPKLSNISGTYTIDGSNDSQDVTDKSFTNLKLTVNKNLKSIKWSAKEGSGEFKFTSKLDFDAKIDKTGKGSTVKVTAGKGTFSPKVSSSSITFD